VAGDRAGRYEGREAGTKARRKPSSGNATRIMEKGKKAVKKQTAPEEVIPMASGPEWPKALKEKGEFKDF